MKIKRPWLQGLFVEGFVRNMKAVRGGGRVGVEG